VTSHPRLDIVEYAGPHHWTWRWTDREGAVREHDVRLDPDSGQFQAFTALPDHLDLYLSPDRGRADEEQVAESVGRWIAEVVLGPIFGALAGAAPGPVRLGVPPEARAVAGLPFELAGRAGESLLDLGVVLVRVDLPTADTVERPLRRVRVLAVLSAPRGAPALANNSERAALEALAGPEVHVEVLQYGATRAALARAVADSEGWHVVHLSGHGAPGTFLLETADAAPDEVDAATLTELLAPLRGRVRLITLAACASAGLVVTRALRVLGWTDATPARNRAGPAAATLAATLADRLGCAVLAMRYQVEDRFTAAFTLDVYRTMLDDGQPLPTAVTRALRSTAAGSGVLTRISPVLFGGTATNLARPQGRTDRSVRGATGVPSRSPWFVGRVDVLTASGSVLADPEAGGVLLIGMPGAGKTACAQEIATRWAMTGEVAWYTADDRADSGLPSEFDAFDARLNSLGDGGLVVLDNAESLLSHGAWRDPRWSELLAVLIQPHARVRLVVTSRRHLPDLPRLRVVPVGPLSGDEAILLASALPDLSRLVAAALPRIPALTQHRLAARSVRVASGHPYLLRLADTQAADPTRLAALLDSADPGWQAGTDVPRGFLRHGGDEADYVGMLTTWSLALLHALPAPQRELARVIATVEASDRNVVVIRENWEGIWRRSGAGAAPRLPDNLFGVLEESALVAVEPDQSVTVHPVVADAIRSATPTESITAIEDQLADFWIGTAAAWAERASDASEKALVDASTSAVPYLRRRGATDIVLDLVHQVLHRDKSRRTASLFLPVLQAAATTAPDARYTRLAAELLADVRSRLAPAPSADHASSYRTLLRDAVVNEDWAAASALSATLAQRLDDAGHGEEAVGVARDRKIYTARGNLGPWTRLGDQVLELQVGMRQLPADQVLRLVADLGRSAGSLAPGRDERETTLDHNVREVLLFIESDALTRLERWTEALSVMDELVALKRSRGALPVELADTEVNRHGPLLELDRFDEARAGLRWCRTVFLDAEQLSEVGLVISALAGVENRAMRWADAVALELDALRFKYAYNGPDAIVVSHHNLAEALAHRDDAGHEAALAHHAAAALIFLVIDDADGRRDAVKAAARDLDRLSATGRPRPAWWIEGDVAGVAAVVDRVPGVDLLRLIPPQADPAALLADVRDRAEAVQAGVESTLSWHLATWDPVIDAIREVRSDGAQRADLDRYLAGAAAARDWRVLARALLFLLRGEPVPDVPMDTVDSAILRRAELVLAGQLVLPVDSWLAFPLRAVIGVAVAVLNGHEDPTLRDTLTEGLAALAEDPEYRATAAAIRAIVLPAPADHDAQETVFELDRAGMAAVQLIQLHAVD
jgi:hypothetical protein